MVHHEKRNELVMLWVGKGFNDMVMDVAWTKASLIGAFKRYHSSTDSTAQRTKQYRAESPTSEIQLETDS